ncbi:cytochrome b5 isoform [Klebsormidium nitens]|uniref:Cytochrome b5 isoform n=1 Tax=Klebsormidium nitens TaxID=105231 RepID=A0A1Y1ILY9_KLENI|nr:cytochrome b5 isoform [Klebsormidium nitens]|eukprot:GAQ91814.1 cytochrome b5 isoform [Klebsormidium nitens]
MTAIQYMHQHDNDKPPDQHHGGTEHLSSLKGLARCFPCGGGQEEAAAGEQLPPPRARRLKRNVSMLSKLAEGSGMGESSATAVTQLQQIEERPAPSGFLVDIPHLTTSDVKLVQESWAKVVEAHGVGAVTLFYVNLFTLAPHLESLFKKTKNIQEAMFTDMMMTLVGKLHDWEWVVSALEASAIRHLRYGVSVSMFPAVGQALLQTLDMGLGVHWTPEVKAAWIKLWTAIVSVMSVHLKADALTRAVACNSLALVAAELDRAPRGERVERPLTKMPSGLTPLLMAIRDKKVDLVKYMLSDILSIRSDRTGYYYGRAQLWATHPTIVNEIVDNVPTAMKELLDGCYWQSGHSTDGSWRANFYIQGLYGEPHRPISKSPLAQMLNLRDNEAFQHPVTGILIFQKWNMFGRRVFFRNMVIGCSAFLLLVLGYVAWPRQIDGLPFRALFWVYIIATLIAEIRRAIAVGFIEAGFLGFAIPIPVHFLSVIQFVRLVMDILVLTAIPFEHTWNKTGKTTESILIATATIAYCFQLLHYYLASRELSSFVFTLSRMMYDLVKFMAVFILIWVGFALAFYILLGDLPTPEGSSATFTSVNWSFTTFFIMLYSYAEFDFQAIENSQVRAVAIVLWFFYLMLANLLLLNLLIAQFATTYEKVYRDSYAVALRKLAHELLAIEGTFSTEERLKHYNKLNFDQPLEFDEFDAGPSGGIQVLQDVDTSADKIVDRIQRFGGKSAPDLPWPGETTENYNLVSGPDNGTDERKPAAPEPAQRKPASPEPGHRKPAEPERRAGRPAASGEGGGEGPGAAEKSPIEFWNNKGQAERFRMIADCRDDSSLTESEAFYRAGVLRGRGDGPVRKRRASLTRIVSAAELAGHKTPKSKWLAIHGKVYDVTTFAGTHPGGLIIDSALGRDATQEFEASGHSDYARGLLKPLKVGRLLPAPSSDQHGYLGG